VFETAGIGCYFWSWLERRMIFLVLPFFLLGCGGSKSLTVQYKNGGLPTKPALIVTVYSDLKSPPNFSQAYPSVTLPSGGELFYYGNKEYLRDCAFATDQVAFKEGYHPSQTKDLTSCTSFATSLNGPVMFGPSTTWLPEDMPKSGKGVSIENSGFVYSLFFFNPTSNTVGSKVNGNKDVESNRCVKVWAAEIQDGVVVGNNGAVVAPVDLNLLECFGF
jgi:hypothetical protein